MSSGWEDPDDPSRDERHLITNTILILNNNLLAGLGLLSALSLLYYSRLRPQYFNKSIGRLIIALTLSDLLYAFASFKGDIVSMPWCCQLFGTLLATAELSCSLILMLLALSVRSDCDLSS